MSRLQSSLSRLQSLTSAAPSGWRLRSPPAEELSVPAEELSVPAAVPDLRGSQRLEARLSPGCRALCPGCSFRRPAVCLRFFTEKTEMWEMKKN